MLVHYSGGKIRFIEPDDPDEELQPCHTHTIHKTIEERVQDLEEAVRELRDSRS